ncbi:MAG: hypothetical protein RL483_154 [Pseudomonadota bacterium]|jgi:hypothetical protein
MTHLILPSNYWLALIYGPVTAFMGAVVAWHENPLVEPERFSLAALQAAVVMVLQLWLKTSLQPRMGWFDRLPYWGLAVLQVLYGAALVNLTVVLIGERSEASGLTLGLVTGLAFASFDLWRQSRSPADLSVYRMAVSLFVACTLLPFFGLMQWMPTAAVWATVAAVPAWKAAQSTRQHVGLASQRSTLLAASISLLLSLLVFSLVLSTLFGQRTNV